MTDRNPLTDPRPDDWQKAWVVRFHKSGGVSILCGRYYVAIPDNNPRERIVLCSEAATVQDALRIAIERRATENDSPCPTCGKLP